MKTILKTAVLASAGLALASGSAFAIGVSYANDDVLLSFRKAGSANDLVVDLGQVSQFQTAVSFDLSTVGLTSADLLSTFNNNLSGVIWSVWAGDAVNQSPIYATRSTLTPFTPEPASSLAQAIGAVNSYGNNDVGGPLGTLVTGSTTEYTVSPTATYGFTKYQGTAGKINGKFEASTDVSGTSGYFFDVGITGTPTVYLGDFTLNSANGDMMWNGSVPEPATYGVLAGFGVLALALRRQLSRKSA